MSAPIWWWVLFLFLLCGLVDFDYLLKMTNFKKKGKMIMSGISLYNYQLDAVKKMKNGCILNGGVGSGKSRTALAYYYLQNGGTESCLSGGADYIPMNDDAVKDLYVITTARKRDTFEWEGELSSFLLSTHPEANLYHNKIVVDSWNNIGKYIDAQNAFFIFDEQRVVGNGKWVKAFLKITKLNSWILLSATPGDTWSDYIPVFIANGFYRNRTEFNSQHVIYKTYLNFPQVDRYVNTKRLVRLRDSILIDMEFYRKTIPHDENVWCDFDSALYKLVSKKRWNPYADEPIINASQLCYVWRRIVNSDESRQVALLEIFEKHPRMIIFYNFDYELDILKGIYYGEDVEIAEWNGHKHQEIPIGGPESDRRWAYLVQYTAGCEGWNCITTDTVVFFSQNYSYKVMEQARGRIDRLNTPFKDLYYYHLKSRSGIDLAIQKALKEKKKFNERRYVGEF